MEIGRKEAPFDGYDAAIVAVGHPIDAELRARLRRSGLNQKLTARAVGRKQAWLNKYMHGAGHATIDDAIRLTAYLMGMVGGGAINETEQQILTACRALSEGDLLEVLRYAEHRARLSRALRREQSKESSAPTPQTPPVTTRRSRGKRSAAELSEK